jgi:hypothetical protein
MKCPKCGKEISHVHVYSECRQTGLLNGNQISSYGSVENIGDENTSVECPECLVDIKDFIKA